MYTDNVIISNNQSKGLNRRKMITWHKLPF